jgi:serine/threonine protein kinase
LQGKAELRDEARYHKVMPQLIDPMKSLRQEDNGAFLRDPGAPEFVSLIRQMVSWNPVNRPSTLEALDHENMQIDENAESAGLKRSRQSVSSTQD